VGAMLPLTRRIPARAYGETRWHAEWKAEFARAGATVERTHRRLGDHHRADVLLPSGTVLEVQRGTLQPRTVRERELAYRRMAWILDGTQLGTRWHIGDKGGVWIKGGCRWWAHCRFPRFVDLGNQTIAQVHSLDLVTHRKQQRIVGQYQLRERADFVQWAVDYL
jgi:hypothetical protein